MKKVVSSGILVATLWCGLRRLFCSIRGRAKEANPFDGLGCPEEFVVPKACDGESFPRHTPAGGGEMKRK